MNCPDFDTLMMLLDGELEEEKLNEVSAHLVSCCRCRDLIDSQKNLEASWRDSFVTPDTDKFRSMEWIIYRRMNRRSRWKFFVPAAAGIIAVLLGVKLIMDNQPFKGRVTELSRDGRTEYASYTLRLVEETDELLDSGIDGTDNETVSEIAPDQTSVDRDILAEGGTLETTSRVDNYSITDGEMPESASEEEDAGESSLRCISSLVQEIDQQTIVGGVVTESVSGAGGSAGFSGYGIEETEIAFETTFMGDAVETGCFEEQTDDISDITLSLDADTTELAAAQTVASSVSPCDESQDNRALPQSIEYYSRFHDLPDHKMDSLKANIYVELVFDADGQPDSCTALILDSLFPDWSDYISLEYSDTVLVIPLADIQQLFSEM